METFVIVFIIVGVIFSLLTLGYVSYDVIKEKKQNSKLEKGGKNG